MKKRITAVIVFIIIITSSFSSFAERGVLCTSHVNTQVYGYYASCSGMAEACELTWSDPGFQSVNAECYFYFDLIFIDMSSNYSTYYYVNSQVIYSNYISGPTLVEVLGVSEAQYDGNDNYMDYDYINAWVYPQ